MINEFYSKRYTYMSYAFSCIGLFLISLNCLAKTQLSFAVNPSSAAQQEIYHLLAKKFETLNPDINVNVTSHSLKIHKLKIIEYLEDGQPFADVFTGYAGDQLNSIVAKDLAMPLNYFWEKNQLDTQFLALSKQVVSSNDIVYALPVNYYQWGIYYKKSIFSKLSINPPSNWQELLSVIATLRANNIVPFGLSGQSTWTLAAWFDYLDLRLNGLDFHLAVLSGKINFTDPRVANIFTHWKQLIDAQAFEAKHLELSWKQSLPPLYRDYTAMILMGNFFIAHLPDSMKNEFDFIAFPNLLPTMPRYENVPFDLVVIAKKTKEPEAALKFLQYLATAETQTLFSNYVGKISPNLLAKPAEQYFILDGKRHIESASGAAQYFDRDAPLAFSSAAQKVFYDFVKYPEEILRTVNHLEALRQKYFNQGDQNYQSL